MRLYAIKLNTYSLDKQIVYADIRLAIQVLAFLTTYTRLAESASNQAVLLSRSEITNEFMIACKIAYKRFELELVKYTTHIENKQELFEYYITLGALTCECADPRKTPRSVPQLDNIDDYATAIIVSFEVSDDALVEIEPTKVYEIETSRIPTQVLFEMNAYMCLVDNFNKTRTESFSPFLGVLQ